MNMVGPQDTTMYWLSRRTRNDLFLLYCFAESGLSTAELRTQIESHSAVVPGLRVRLRSAPHDLAYPVWVPCEFDAEQFIEHRLPQSDWTSLEDALGELLDTGVDAAVRPWRIHVFRGIVGAPLPESARGDAGPTEERAGGASGGSADRRKVTVAVVQMSHALADGKRAADLARALFSPSAVLLATPTSELADSPTLPGRRASNPRQQVRGDDGAQAVVGSVENGRPGETGIPVAVRTGGHAGLADDGGSAQSERIGTRTSAVDRGGELVRRAACSAGDLVRSGVDLVRLGVAVVGIPVGMARTMAGGVRAYRAKRELAELTAAGDLPEAGGGFAPGVLNGPGEVGGHRVRMIVCPAGELRVSGFSVTVVALTAVSMALERYLLGRGESADRLGAQVPMALTEPSAAHNNYRSLGIDLFAGEPDPRRRAERIAADLAARRTRAAHPLLAVQDRVTAGLPAPILRRDVDRYPIDTVPDSIAGHTVVSSVHRGPADLTFGSAPVLFTAGFPALGAVMHLTHGIHGLGDTVTISIHADPETVPELDEYADMVRTAVTAFAEGTGAAE
ncbi:WS/DGAT domain-containing protein [Nocardia cyriacigeorgica]|uniref:WS/DGAT domain-containing protein n=1 Tax=Nocardia cyriacigeorgica TaxID=135487 RepID=UPI002455C861|nr:WS/DGAT domain-containing protein [Nocardia cyriacigeorgica]